MKRPYRIVLESFPESGEWWWMLLSPNGKRVAASFWVFPSKASAKRSARNAVLAMVTRPVIVEEKSNGRA